MKTVHLSNLIHISILVYIAFYESNDVNAPRQLTELVSYLWLNQVFFSLINMFYKDKEIINMIKSGNIAYELARPKTIKGKSKQLGVWDYETQGNPYTEFKTLGAKRYLVKQGDELHITVAGIPKRAGVKFLSKYKDPFKVFSDDMIIPEGESDKLIATYLDDGFETVIKDYLGN